MVRILFSFFIVFIVIACLSKIWTDFVPGRLVGKWHQTKHSSDQMELPDQFTAVLTRYIGNETAPVKGTDGLWHVVYELWLTNGKQVPATINKIEVLNFDDQQEVIKTLVGKELLASMFQLSTEPATDTVLEPNESLLEYVELAFAEKHQIPDRIVHRLSGTGANNPGSREPVAIDYLFLPWDISKRTLPVINAPLSGAGWVAINGCCSSKGAHRGAIQTVNGTLMDSQRYAIDWVRLDENNRFVEGDPKDVRNWIGYDAPVFAIADATVVEVVDDLPDQVPGKLPDPSTITLKTVDGNHIILDLGNGVYAFYAHFKKGSITVKKGDIVRAGQKIAHLGNSGNTSAPHLHLHLMDRPSAIVSDGIPYVFNSITVHSAIDQDEWFDAENIYGTWTIVNLDDPVIHKNELPLDLSIVEFPNAI